MIGLLIVTHGELGKALVGTANIFASDTTGVEYICFKEGEGVEDLRDAVNEKLSEMNEYESVLSFVDIPGGSPARVMSELVISNPKIELITGTNLPLLVEAIVSRNDMDSEKLVDHLVHVSRESITNVGSMLRS